MPRIGSRDYESDDPHWVDAEKLGPAMLEHYVEHYGKDAQWKVIITEQPARQTVWVNGKPAFEYVFTLDGVWENQDTGKLWIPDHKTTSVSRIDSRYLRLDDQASAYWTWGVDWLYENRMLKPDQKLAGMLFNFLRKAEPDPRPKDPAGRCLNKDGTISKQQPPPYFIRQPIYRDEYEREVVRERAIQEYNEMRAVRGGLVPAYKSPSPFNCPNCWLLDICELHEVGADYQELIENTASKWDPYDPYYIEGERR
jgi:Zierdtviridae exonuclease